MFDDSLSALDAHVGQAVFTDAIQNMLKGKTRLLVTHQLHFLPYVDWVVCIEQGKVVEQGTYQDLMRKNGEGGFARFMNEFGGSGALGQEVQIGKSDSEMDSEERVLMVDAQEVKNEQKAIDEAAGERVEQTKAKPQQQKLMQSEDRNVGSVNIKGEYESLQSTLFVKFLDVPKSTWSSWKPAVWGTHFLCLLLPYASSRDLACLVRIGKRF